MTKKKRKHYDVLLVGAGLFNATLTWRLTHVHKKKVLVIDRREHIGGNCYTELRDGIHVHKYGAHIFHTSNERVWRFATHFCKFNGFINSPIAIDAYGVPWNLPFNMNTIGSMFGTARPDDARRAIRGSLIASGIKPPYDNLESKAIAMVGKDIYDRLIKEYTEKQWGRPCTELSPDIIGRLPIRFTYDNNYFNDTYQGIPVDGYTSWIEAMLEGADVELGVDFLKDKEKWLAVADKVYYSGCVDEYFEYVFGPLDYRSLKFRERAYKTDNYQGNAVFNYTSKRQKYTRSIEHRFFMDRCTAKGTVVSYEYPQKWKPGMEPYYPVNNELNNGLYDRYRVLFPKNVVPVGRLGMYRYMDMDDTIEAALNISL